MMLALAVAVGAWWAAPLPRWPGAVVVLAALVWSRPKLLVLGGFLLASTLGARAMAGLASPEPASFRGPATLVGDPQPMAFGSRVDVRVGRHRYELWASGSGTGVVTQAQAGERILVEGRIRPSRPGSDWLIPRHVIGRLDATRIDRLDAGAAPWRAANRFRLMLKRGAEVVSEPSRSLYGGFVLGDDRGQPPEIVDDFRGAGLTHLLVVSGQNVAFVLVLARPLTGRLGLTARWAVTIGVIGAFAVVTRFEPSVLRASVMAALAVTATSVGRPASTVRVLALAVAGLVLVDPLLMRSVGFQLSVAASLGIAVGARRIADHLPGPRLMAEALGVTLAAQLGVAPVLVPRFGGMPVVAIVANLLAVPVAGLVTTWGLPAGIVAGLGGSAVARIVHLPTQLFIAWVAGVARVSASMPLGELGPVALVVLVVCAMTYGLLARARSRSSTAVRGLVVAVMAAVLVLPAIGLTRPPTVRNVAEGARLFRSGGATVLVVEGRIDVEDVMAGLRRAGTRRIDVMVARPDLYLLRALRHRWSVGTVIDAATASFSETQVGGLLITVGSNGSDRQGVDAPESVTVAAAPR